MDRTRRYTIEIKDIKTGATLLFAGAEWTPADLNVVLAQNMRLAPLAPKLRRYVVEIKDMAGKTSLYLVTDWTKKQLKAAISENLRLAGLPDGSGPAAPANDKDPSG